MSEVSQEAPVSFESLPCSDLLYRPVIDRRWFDRNTAEINDQTFRRKRSDKTGLSVNPARNYSVQQCIDCSAYTECFAVGTLHVGRVLDLGLNVILDSPHHGNIMGLPAYDETGPENDARREYLAIELLKQFRLLWCSVKMRPRRNPLNLSHH